MYKKSKVVFLYAETPLHAGGGMSLGAVDMPLQREKHTGYPMVQASGVKGSLRSLVSENLGITDKKRELEDLKRNIEPGNNIELTDLIFGPEEGEEYAGSLSFTDARLLLMPVRSLKGIFAWITSIDVLNRFQRDIGDTGNKIPIKITNPKDNRMFVTKDSKLLLSNNKVVLEEYTFDGITSESASDIAKFLCKNVFPQNNTNSYWKERMMTNLAILPDDYFKHFTLNSTEIIDRISIGDKGVVKEGPWQEENLPSDSILYTLAMATDPLRKNDKIKDKDRVMDFFIDNVNGKVFQMGGKSTIGRGILRATIPNGGTHAVRP